MILHLSLNLPEDGQYIKIVRLLSTTLLDYMQVVEQDVQEIEFVIGELCSNVTRHANSIDGRFHVAVDYFPDKICIEVKDRGGGFSLENIKPVGTVRDDVDGTQRIGGFGLFLVEKMSDHLEFEQTEPTGTTVRAVKILHYTTEKNRDDAIELNDMRSGGSLKVVP
jgi:anti-sigma regulatory factor (Ser/Thr protein kinase)